MFTPEPRLAFLFAAAGIAGFVRGFSGFGGAMLFMPLASLAYDPKLAVVWIFVSDVVASLPMLFPAFRSWNWREVLPLSAGAMLVVPFGVEILKAVDPVALRWAMSGAILVTVALLATGVRYEGRLPWQGSVGVGALSGLTGGAIGMAGPPVVLLWLGGRDHAGQMRANLIAYFGLLALVRGLSLTYTGLMAGPQVIEGILLIPAYGLPLALGTRLFARASDRYFRYGALGICAAAALMGLPVW